MLAWRRVVWWTFAALAAVVAALSLWLGVMPPVLLSDLVPDLQPNYFLIGAGIAVAGLAAFAVAVPFMLGGDQADAQLKRGG